jgi:hypothetical protein
MSPELAADEVQHVEDVERELDRVPLERQALRRAR